MDTFQLFGSIPLGLSSVWNGIKKVSDLLWGSLTGLGGEYDFSVPDFMPPPASSENPFDFEEWLNRDCKPICKTKDKIDKDIAKYSKIWGTRKFEAPKPPQPSVPTEVFAQHIPPKVQSAPLPSDPALFDMRLLYPSYLLSAVYETPLFLKALSEKHVSFQPNYSEPQYDAFINLEKSYLDDYCKKFVELVAENYWEIGPEWIHKEAFLKSLVVYKNYTKNLLPAFRNDVRLSIYIDVTRKRVFTLLQNLATSPEAYETCIAELGTFLHQVKVDFGQAYTLLLHYLSDLLLSYIELPETDTADSFIWLGIAAWLHNFQTGTSDNILRAHFMMRCPQIIGLTFTYADDMPLSKLKKLWAYKPKNYLVKLKKELLTPLVLPTKNSPRASTRLSNSKGSLEADCFETDDVTFSDEEVISKSTKVLYSERTPSLSELALTVESAPFASKFSSSDDPEANIPSSSHNLDPKPSQSSEPQVSTHLKSEPQEVELESNEEYKVRMSRMFVAYETLKAVRYMYST